jgi:hypothetical protein
MAMGVELARITSERKSSNSLANWGMHDVARTPAIDELDIAALDPAERVKGLLENHDPRLAFRVIRYPHQHAHPPHAIRLLRACRKRPHGRAAKQRDELPPLHLAQDHRLPRRGERYR